MDARVSEPYDAEAIDRLFRLAKPDRVRRIVDVFLDDVPSRVTRALEAGAAEDLEGVEAAVHSLKSSAAQFGLRAMAERCARAEALCMARDLPAAMNEVVAVAAELPSALAWVRTSSQAK